jgi:hypothetical protein
MCITIIFDSLTNMLSNFIQEFPSHFNISKFRIGRGVTQEHKNAGHGLILCAELFLLIIFYM